MPASFLLFLAGSEVDLRRFRGTLGKRVAVTLAISVLASACVVGVQAALGVGGAAVIGVALLATALGLVVPVLLVLLLADPERTHRTTRSSSTPSATGCWCRSSS